MQVFRSEAHLDAYLKKAGREPGAVFSLEQLGDLAVRWYGDRLDENFGGRTMAEAQAVFLQVGLTGSFWEP